MNDKDKELNKKVKKKLNKISEYHKLSDQCTEDDYKYILENLKAILIYFYDESGEFF